MKGTDLLLLRRKLGLSQQHLGKQLGYSQNRVSELERREYLPLEVREKIRKIEAELKL